MREHLARALEEAGAPSYFIQRVRDGAYDHFRSTRVNPHGERPNQPRHKGGTLGYRPPREGG
jgi:hypothetical protein